MKNAPPSNDVIIPTGNSSGGKIILDTKSATTSRIPPHTSIVASLFLMFNIFTIFGTIIPIMPIVPHTLTTTAVNITDIIKK